MKKVLFATTALVATAGVAAADVTFGGYGRFGALYDGSDWTVESRYRLVITASTESDGGITFGAMARIQQNESQAQGEMRGSFADFTSGDETANASDSGINAVRFFVRSGNLEIGVGNIFGALEYMSGQYTIDLGLTGLGYDYVAYDINGDYYSSGAGGSAPNAVEVIYSMGDFAVHASASDVNDRRAIVGSYTYSDWTFAVGLQDSDLDSDTEWTISVQGQLGIATVGLAFADNGTNGDRTVLSGRVDVGASTNVEAYYADDSIDGDGYGIDFNHNLGGGVSLRGGVAERMSGDTVADFGVRFNF